MTAQTALARTVATPAPDGHLYEVIQMGLSCYYDSLQDAIQSYQEAAEGATSYTDHPCLLVDGLSIHSDNLLWGDGEPRPLHIALEFVREQIARGY